MAYRSILAVTFTNKAAAEMKRRILDELSEIAAGKNSPILNEITKNSNMPSVYISPEKKADFILSAIISDYSRFAVGTIDSFFQRIFRAFAREIGVQTNFSLYLKHDQILSDTISEMVNNLTDDDTLREWIVNYAGKLFDEGKRIKLEESIYNLAHTVFTEKYKLLPEEAKTKLSDLNNIKQVIRDLEMSAESFRKTLRTLASEAGEILDKNGITDSMLAGGQNGVGRFLRSLRDGEIKAPFVAVIKSLDNDNWKASKGDTSRVDLALADGFAPKVRSVVSFFERGIIEYKEANIVLKDIHMAAILGDVAHAVKLRTNAENSFVLADTGDLLMNVIGNDQTPFIYEKTGNEYNLFMIDEFQDTSTIQYRNFKPLLENSISQGFDSLIVGDVKQSIYRWRNGDWSILGKLLESDFTRDRVESVPLLTNWRSLPEIVKFNNTLFSVLPSLMDMELGLNESGNKLSEVYANAVQSVPQGKKGGYVRIENISINNIDIDAGITPKEKILFNLSQIIRKCEDDGYEASDIGILVRTKSEGTIILDYLNSYSASLQTDEKQRYNFNLLSADSLIVGNSDTVRFIVAAMKRSIDKKDSINRGEMLRFFHLTTMRGEGESVLSFSSVEKSEYEQYPNGFEEFLSGIVTQPLFTLSESIISFFGLNGEESDMAAISFFQDQVLNYMNENGSDLKGFTEWWDEEGSGQEIILSGDQNAIRIMTIHKAKGLQFKVVFVPFISWQFTPKNKNLIWIEPEHDPLRGIGAFPVEYNKDMIGTGFEKYYTAELWSSFLDNINLLYVSFTRAEERLYGFTLPGKKNDAGAILFSALSTSNQNLGFNTENDMIVDLPDFLNSDGNVYEQGAIHQNSPVRSEESLIDAVYPVYSGEGRLRLRLNGSNIMRLDEKKPESKAFYGTVLHDILSNIFIESDIPLAVDAAVKEGLISADRSSEIIEKLRNMVGHPLAKQWFETGAEVFTEPAILTGKGDIRRPDRVIIRDKSAFVIDYKFGEERLDHIHQISAYKNLLDGLGFKVEKAILWYVENNKIVEV